MDAYDKNRPILNVKKGFEGFLQELQNLLKKVESSPVAKDFFEVDIEVDHLYREAVGCRECCLYCKRKCELGPHTE